MEILEDRNQKVIFSHLCKSESSLDFLAFQNQTRIIETSEEISDRPQSFQSPSTES
jgi:uncharacterized protein Yka (UPF0111/DUF47 family)